MGLCGRFVVAEAADATGMLESGRTFVFRQLVVDDVDEEDRLEEVLDIDIDEDVDDEDDACKLLKLFEFIELNALVSLIFMFCYSSILFSRKID